MEAFKNFMTETAFLLPNWSWIAIALVVAAMIIIIVCTVVAGRKKKQGRAAVENSSEKELENGAKTDSADGVQDDGFDKLIEPFYPVPENAVIYEGSAVQTDEISAPAEETFKENITENSEPVEAQSEEPAKELEYSPEQIGEPAPVDEVTYSAVIVPVEENEAKPKKSAAAKKTPAKSASGKKSTAKKPAAKKSTAKKSAAKKPAAEKAEAKTVKLVKEDEVKDAPAPAPAETEKKPEAKPKKSAAAKKSAPKNTAAKKSADKKSAEKKTTPAKNDSVPKVSEVLTEDIPEPARTEPEVAPVKPVAKQTVLKQETKKEAPQKETAKKPAAKKTAEAVKAEPKKPAAKKSAEKKPAVKKSAAKKANIADVSQKVAKATPTGEEKVYHVSRRPQDNKWEVRIEGSSKAIKLFRTKAEAMDYAIPLAGDDSDNVRVIIHRADGRPKNVAFL